MMTLIWGWLYFQGDHETRYDCIRYLVEDIVMCVSSEKQSGINEIAPNLRASELKLKLSRLMIQCCCC